MIDALLVVGSMDGRRACPDLSGVVPIWSDERDPVDLMVDLLSLTR